MHPDIRSEKPQLGLCCWVPRGFAGGCHGIWALGAAKELDFPMPSPRPEPGAAEVSFRVFLAGRTDKWVLHEKKSPSLEPGLLRFCANVLRTAFTLSKVHRRQPAKGCSLEFDTICFPHNWQTLNSSPSCPPISPDWHLDKRVPF